VFFGPQQSLMNGKLKGTFIAITRVHNKGLDGRIPDGISGRPEWPGVEVWMFAKTR
jgi:hypothetical protein